MLVNRLENAPSWWGLPLLVLATAGCTSSSEPGTSVSFVSSGLAFSAEQGLRVGENELLRVDALFWTSAELELRACRSAWSRAVDWWVPSAQAHGLSTPTLVAVPTVESAQTAFDVTLGKLSPPPGEYCAVRYRIAAADGDALGLAEHPEVLGAAFLSRGALVSAGRAPEAFELSSVAGLELELSLSLDLTGARPDAVVRLSRNPEAVFESISLEEVAPAERPRVLIESLLSQVRLDVE